MWGGLQDPRESFKHLGEVQASLQVGQGLSPSHSSGLCVCCVPRKAPFSSKGHGLPAVGHPCHPRSIPVQHPRCPARPLPARHHDIPQLGPSLPCRELAAAGPAPSGRQLGQLLLHSGVSGLYPSQFNLQFTPTTAPECNTQIYAGL